MLKKPFSYPLKSKNTASLLILFSLSQLYKFYAYLGYQSAVTNVSNSYYILGFYNNISVIDLYKTLNILKINFTILLKVLVYKYGSFLVINENINKHVSPLYVKKFSYAGISYFFGN
jgi:ribosomal protein S2